MNDLDNTPIHPCSILHEAFPQAITHGEAGILKFQQAKKTMAQGLVPCEHCGESSCWEDTELVAYYCQRCMDYELRVGGEFGRQPLQPNHLPSWLEQWVLGDNGPMPTIA